MSDQDKIEILQEVFDVDWSVADEPMDESLRKFTYAVINDFVQAWYDDHPFIETLLDNFADDHPLWDFIRLD